MRVRAYRLRDQLRPYQPLRVRPGRAIEGECYSRQRGCGHTRISHEVAILAYGGRAAYRGVLTCGSVWSCPACSVLIRWERGQEITHAVGAWDARRVVMVSLTIRHGLGDSLRRMRRGIATAQRLMQQGRVWQGFKRGTLMGTVRALETTHGAHGWHPHLHLLFFLRAEPTASELQQIENFLSIRWQDCVVRALGREHMPDVEHGCVVTPCHQGDYLAKLGLEITSDSTKRGEGGSRTPWEIAHDLVEHGEAADLALWQTYARGMHRARMLTWSKGLRTRVGLRETEQTDQEIVENELIHGPAHIVCTIGARIWDALRVIPGASARLLGIAERDGRAGVQATLDGLARLGFFGSAVERVELG